MSVYRKVQSHLVEDLFGDVPTRDARSNAETAALHCVTELGFHGYKYCLLWRQSGRINSMCAYTHGIMKNSFGVNDIIRHQRGDCVIEKIIDGSAPFIWECSRSAKPCVSAFGRKHLTNPTLLAASVPVCLRHSALCASLHVFAEGQSLAEFERRFHEAAPSLTLLANILYTRLWNETAEAKMSQLSTSEQIVFENLAAGRRIEDIATILGKSPSTINNQIASAKHRLNANTISEAIFKWSNSWLQMTTSKNVIDLESCP